MRYKLVCKLYVLGLEFGYFKINTNKSTNSFECMVFDNITEKSLKNNEDEAKDAIYSYINRGFTFQGINFKELKKLCDF
ncbi:hypothetical protein [Bacillus sp. AR18-7]|uniref:hypothetical protein n=1 Tax=Bacillus sp. AR18-7 TaxID=2217821 RepID=UPI0011CC430A|nr:hypothetical protein [Bacillus sp. AR18-7]TXR64500.1 hypothetical protein DN395_11200 [Bacillus sp. AR18-7]